MTDVLPIASRTSWERAQARLGGRRLVLDVEILEAPEPSPRAGRSVATTRTGKHYVKTYTPTKARQTSWRIRQACLAQLPPGFIRIRKPAGAIIEVLALLPIPESTAKMRRTTILPVARPDVDNLAKLLIDSLEPLWMDDTQVVKAMVTKLYAVDDFGDDILPRWCVRVWSVE